MIRNEIAGLTIRNIKYYIWRAKIGLVIYHNEYPFRSDKIPDKYAIVQTYQTIFGHHIIVITLLNTWHVVLSLKQLAGNSCKVPENVSCPAVIVSP